MQHVATLTIHQSSEGDFVASFADLVKQTTKTERFTGINSARVWLHQLAAHEWAHKRGYRIYGQREPGTYRAFVYIT